MRVERRERRLQAMRKDSHTRFLASTLACKSDKDMKAVHFVCAIPDANRLGYR